MQPAQKSCRRIPSIWMSPSKGAFRSSHPNLYGHFKTTGLLWSQRNSHNTGRYHPERIGMCQLQEGHPIAFASKSLTKTEMRYANIKTELLTVVFTCEWFHTYIYGCSFLMRVITYHLEWYTWTVLCTCTPTYSECYFGYSSMTLS